MGEREEGKARCYAKVIREEHSRFDVSYRSVFVKVVIVLVVGHDGGGN